MFHEKNGQRKYKYFFLGRGKSDYKHSDSARKFYETVIINMVEFLIDNIFDMFDGRVLQETVGISMGTNSAPLLASACSFIRTSQTSCKGFSMKTKGR